MSYSGDAAEQVVRMSLEGAEVAAKITGAGAKQVAVLLYAILREQKKTKGKTRLTNMLRSGKELKVFAVKDTDLKQFCEASKKYGVLYCVLKDRNADDGITDVMVRAEDASKINRIFERMGYPAPVKEDTATKKENARAPSGNSSKERGTGARASTEPAAEKADTRPSVRSRLMALQAAAERDGTAPTKDTVREAIQKAMPTRE